MQVVAIQKGTPMALEFNDRKHTNVGFEPGWVGGRPPLFSKYRYQQMLYRDMYAAKDMRDYYRYPAIMGLTYFAISFIVACVFGALAVALLVGIYGQSIIAGIFVTPLLLPLLVYGFKFLRTAWRRYFIRGVLIQNVRNGKNLYELGWSPQQIANVGGEEEIYRMAFISPEELEAEIEWRQRFM